jgi:FKBP-type peptidyl-prolyl cis-trans isomerase FklB
MKKPVSILLFLLIAVMVFGQSKPVKKPVIASTVTFKNQTDSLSYALGMSLANFYKQQGITKINTVFINKAINDVMNNGKPLMTEEQMGNCINSYLQVKQAEKSAAQRKANSGILDSNHKAGDAYLAANKSRSGVVTTQSGLQYEIIKQGDGPKPLATDKVKCHYTGTLINGKVFDSSVERGQPAEFALSGVIQGWTEALQLMPVGSKWRLVIPPGLAWGDNAAGPIITPGSTVVFEVELLDIVK